MRLPNLKAGNDGPYTIISGNINERILEIDLLTLFTHVTTHEFHHKGQILTMSRLLGYTPIDTDIIRF